MSDPEFIRRLEIDCEIALAEAVSPHFEELPPRIAHLMAKAAITVLEAVVDEEEEP